MAEILNLLFNPLSNAIMTTLTGISLLYWLFTMFMGEGFDFGGDADIQFEGADVQDVDVDTNVDADAADIQEPSFMQKAMDYINIGKAPLMVIVTLFKFIGWIITIISSLAFQLTQFGWKSVLILIPVLLITYFLMHYVTIPVVKLYKNVGYEGEESHDFLGRVGKMRSSIQGGFTGSAEFIIEKAVIRLNVRSANGQKLNYGDDVIVVNESKDKRYYYVEKNLNLENI